jgi:hypothetical protein
VTDQFVPVERPHRRCAVEAVLVQRLDERASSQLGVLVGLLEVPGRDSRAEHEPSLMVDLLTREQTQQVTLAGARDAAPCGQGYRNHRAPASNFPKREASSGCVSVVKVCG